MPIIARIVVLAANEEFCLVLIRYRSVVSPIGGGCRDGRNLRSEKHKTINMLIGRVMSAPMIPIVIAKPVTRIGPIFMTGCASSTYDVFRYVKSRMLASIAVNRMARTEVSRSARVNGERGCFVATENHR